MRFFTSDRGSFVKCREGKITQKTLTKFFDLAFIFQIFIDFSIIRDFLPFFFIFLRQPLKFSLFISFEDWSARGFLREISFFLDPVHEKSHEDFHISDEAMKFWGKRGKWRKWGRFLFFEVPLLRILKRKKGNSSDLAQLSIDFEDWDRLCRGVNHSLEISWNPYKESEIPYAYARNHFEKSDLPLGLCYW